MLSCWRNLSPVIDAVGGNNCFYTSFNCGHGKFENIDGKIVNDSSWTSLRYMDVQPFGLLHYGMHKNEKGSKIQASVSYEYAYQGGSCIHYEVRVKISIFM